MNIKVLFLPSFYQQPGRPVLGLFFKDQALMVKSAGIDVSLAYVEMRSLHQVSVRGLLKSRFQVTCTEEEGLLTLRQKGWNPLVQTTLGGKIWSRLTQKIVNQFIKHFGAPDLIHAHNSLWAGFTAAKIADKHGIPYVLTEHSSLFLGNKAEDFREYISLATRKANRVLAVSQAQANRLADFNNGKPPIVVHNIVDTAFFSLPAEEPQRVPFVFLAIGNLYPVKGFHILLKAFALKFRGDPNVVLKIGGDGFQKADLVKLTQKLEIVKQVRFLGLLSRLQVRAAMWRSHSLVVSSFMETFGIVLIEAISTGLPVIATRCGGPEEIVTSKVGLLVEPANENQLACAMVKMRHNSRFNRNVLRKHVLDRCSHAVVSKQLLSVYKQTLCGE